MNKILQSDATGSIVLGNVSTFLRVQMKIQILNNASYNISQIEQKVFFSNYANIWHHISTFFLVQSIRKVDAIFLKFSYGTKKNWTTKLF